MHAHEPIRNAILRKFLKKYEIAPFNPRAVLSQVSTSSRAPLATTSSGRFHLKTPYTKCELRQQTNLTLEFIKTATGGELYKLILRFSHNTSYMAVQADIAHGQAEKLRETVKQIRPSKKGLRRLGKGNLAGVATGEDILSDV